LQNSAFAEPSPAGIKRNNQAPVGQRAGLAEKRNGVGRRPCDGHAT
jgi:hypothetical protein